MWQRADVHGRFKIPKLSQDRRRLQDLFAYCQDANMREVRAIVCLYPYLLAHTDQNGFTALHYAEMSGDPVFMAKVLQMYRDPKTYTLKVVTYESEKELLNDIRKGLVVQRASTSESEVGTPSLALTHKARVRDVGHGTKASQANIMIGDTLEAVTGSSLVSWHQPPPPEDDPLDALREGRPSSFGFPVTLQFLGSASSEILCSRGWTPTHAAAGGGGPQFSEITDLLLSEEANANNAHDVVGCKPLDWLGIVKASEGRNKRKGRPLSAGRPVGTAGKVKWPPKMMSVASSLTVAAAEAQKSRIAASVPPVPSEWLNCGAKVCPAVSRPLKFSTVGG